MRMPTRFKLLGRTIEVKHDAKHLEASGAYGEWHLERGLILVQKPTKDRSAEWVGHVFCHELMHALFDSAGRDDLSKDETLVDTLGGLLHQALSTMEYE